MLPSIMAMKGAERPLESPRSLARAIWRAMWNLLARARGCSLPDSPPLWQRMAAEVAMSQDWAQAASDAQGGCSLPDSPPLWQRMAAEVAAEVAQVWAPMQHLTLKAGDLDFDRYGHHQLIQSQSIPQLQLVHAVKHLGWSESQP